MVRYKDRKNNTFYYTLMKDCEVLGTFGNLKALCSFVEDENFPSYWTLIRKKEDLFYAGSYKIQRVKHYSGTNKKKEKE